MGVQRAGLCPLEQHKISSQRSAWVRGGQETAQVASHCTLGAGVLSTKPGTGDPGTVLTLGDLWWERLAVFMTC